MKRSVLLLAALAALAAPTAAQAETAVSQARPEAILIAQARGDDEGPRISLSEVVRRLRATRQGSMLDAQATTRGGRAIYVVIWEYPGGRIGNIYVDARTGAVIGED
jgi:uncharacterized membrane protein YkoI